MTRRAPAPLRDRVLEQHASAGLPVLRCAVGLPGDATRDVAQLPGLGRGIVRAADPLDTWAELETARGNGDALFLVDADAEPVVVLPWSTYLRLRRGTPSPAPSAS